MSSATIKKWGGSLALVIPASVSRRHGFTDGMPVEIAEREGEVVIRRVGRRPRRPIDEIVKSLTPRQPLSGWDDAAPTGKEVW